MSGIVPVFGVPVGHYSIENFDKMSKLLNSIDLEKCTKRVNDDYLGDWDCNVKTGMGLEKNNLEHFWVSHFLNEIKSYILDYIDSIKTTENIMIIPKDPWINLYESGDYQEIHDHLGNNSIISYCYFHKLPEGSGNFILIDENAQKNYFSQLTPPLLLTAGMNYNPEVKEGDLIIFPSWVKHKVTLNKSKDPRITVSGNIAVQPTEEFNK